MKPCCSIVCYVALLVSTLAIDFVAPKSSSSVARDGRLLPLERQRKSVERDLDLILPATRPSSVFRERQRQLNKQRGGLLGEESDDVNGVELPTDFDSKSIFSERRRHQNLMKNDVNNNNNRRHRLRSGNDVRKRMFSVKRKQKKDDDDDEEDDFEVDKRRGLRALPGLHGNWDPRFPAFDIPDKRRRFNWDIEVPDRDEDDGERPEPAQVESVESLLRRLAWSGMRKRLMLLNDARTGESYLDRGERKRSSSSSSRGNKRIGSDESPAVAQDELEDIMTDDNCTRADEKKRGFNPGRTAAKVHLTSKGKDWLVPQSLDSVRSKKIKWDDYLGVDKRSGDTKSRDDDDDDGGQHAKDRTTSDADGLKDFLVKWYLEKMRAEDNGEGRRSASADEDDLENIVMNDWTKRGENDEDDDDEADGPLKTVDDRLRRIEDVVLLKANNLLEGRGGDSAEREEYVLEHLKAAFSLEKMRNDLKEFETSLVKLKMFDEYQDGGGGDDDDDKDERKKKRKKNYADFHPSDTSVSAKAAAPPQQQPPAAQDGQEQSSDDTVTPQVCPVWTDAVVYCDDLGQALGDAGPALTRSCVEHMICYACEGGSASSSSSSCDRLYLSRATDVCDDDFRCQAMAGAMRSVFLSEHDEFRRRNHAHCVRDQCLAKIILGSVRARIRA